MQTSVLAAGCHDRHDHVLTYCSDQGIPFCMVLLKVGSSVRGHCFWKKPKPLKSNPYFPVLEN
jgi:hypothetical protein